MHICSNYCALAAPIGKATLPPQPKSKAIPIAESSMLPPIS